MPLYEYRCEHCGDVFEVMQKFSDEPLKQHEKCGSGPVVRLLSAPALQFKGSGWYITDYAKNSSSSPSGNSGTSSKDGGAGSDGAKSKESAPSGPSSSSSGSSSGGSSGGSGSSSGSSDTK